MYISTNTSNSANNGPPIGKPLGSKYTCLSTCIHLSSTCLEHTLLTVGTHSTEGLQITAKCNNCLFLGIGNYCLYFFVTSEQIIKVALCNHFNDFNFFLESLIKRLYE